MTTASVSYIATVTLTITLTSLASSSTLLAGRESTAVSNLTELAVDYMVGGKTKTGSTTPLAGVIEYWAYGSYDGGTTFSGGATGSDANLTFASEKTNLQLLYSQPTDTTASHSYEWGPYSIASAFGFVPSKWGIYVVHNTSAAFTATAADYAVKADPVHFTSA